ncbi:sigma-54 interaction domain-containing protein [Fusibacter sp. JL216-2]|uniref:sigma-54 interaction domain-containing protein n=1 Tax=Fusibacter sp. JL216-2 TaxID=3071453 RepID=UPI003D34541F
MKLSYKELQEQMEMIDEFIEQAYEGMIIVDAKGIVTKCKYEKLLGIKEKDAIGKHVTKVIENTRLHRVLETGESEIGDIQKMNGHDMVTSRIPIKRGGEIIGAVGTVLFRDVVEVKYMANYIETMNSQMKKHKKEIKRLNQAKYSFDNILTQNPHMIFLKETAKRAAETSSTVCIEGGSGTGKEFFAHAIHKGSHRKYGPFVKINCAAIPKDLLESELFGYEPGAFTGASSTGKVGKFEIASGGTIFLDEIGTMPLEMQAKLLRVLEEREFERVGGHNKVEVDVRVISATNEDLRSLVSKKKFREDLYYRLEVVSIKIPPLSQRREDIALIAHSMLKSFVSTYPTCPTSFSEGAMKKLQNYAWPGNVRELRNVVESSINMALTKVIYTKDLPEYIQESVAFEQDVNTQKPSHDTPMNHVMNFDKNTDLNIKRCVDETEKKIIKEAIDRCDGNKTEAAKLLGLHRTALYKKIDKLGLDI